MKKIILILIMTISCVGIKPTPEDSVPQCCNGQESHTCDMPDMIGKPSEK